MPPHFFFNLLRLIIIFFSSPLPPAIALDSVIPAFSTSLLYSNLFFLLYLQLVLYTSTPPSPPLIFLLLSFTALPPPRLPSRPLLLQPLFDEQNHAARIIKEAPATALRLIYDPQPSPHASSSR